MTEFEFDCAVEDVFELLTDPDFIVERSLAIAAQICVYTNDQVTIEELGSEGPGPRA